jgi:hypothetical protein
MNGIFRRAENAWEKGCQRSAGSKDAKIELVITIHHLIIITEAVAANFVPLSLLT